MQKRLDDFLDHLVSGLTRIHVAVALGTGPIPDLPDFQLIQFIAQNDGNLFRVHVAQVQCSFLGDTGSELIVLAGQGLEDRQCVAGRKLIDDLVRVFHPLPSQISRPNGVSPHHSRNAHTAT